MSSVYIYTSWGRFETQSHVKYRSREGEFPWCPRRAAVYPCPLFAFLLCAGEVSQSGDRVRSVRNSRVHATGVSLAAMEYDVLSRINHRSDTILGLDVQLARGNRRGRRSYPGRHGVTSGFSCASPARVPGA